MGPIALAQMLLSRQGCIQLRRFPLQQISCHRVGTQYKWSGELAFARFAVGIVKNATTTQDSRMHDLVLSFLPMSCVIASSKTMLVHVRKATLVS